MKSGKCYVESQKGPLHADFPKTSKMMTHKEHLAEAQKQASERRDGQTLKTHVPRR